MNLFNRNGRILKVRLGYNANSSSIAAMVSLFLWGAGAAVIVVNLVAAAIFQKQAGSKTGQDGQ